MTTERYQRGWNKLMEVGGGGGAAERVIESLKDIAPDVANYIIEFAFGDIYSREGLNPKQRQLLTIASLTTQGGVDSELYAHLHGALNVGLSTNEVVEAITHCISYAGFPRVLNAISVAKRVFEERNVKVETSQEQE
ncbi:carboxymuconolactone decarboxylase family protein [Paenibacillus sp. IHBB 10380]|uniref:carboxymuconolactone decarboxylase family protein n=1 Tax=Paenibacillus sp. IHBB 10380 TaxID=1566358 RepID=UPI0005CFEA4D|nr:carboxymuconolactone decarboxylase family protein [Paenibacillus sp. IHBB 10380]AJS57611.1 carboxymuconolactone decarboxylase [Paenibacillus sp. IHBB 10380]